MGYSLASLVSRSPSLQMMDMSPSAAFIVGIVVLLSVIAVIVVGMRVVGQRLKDGEEQPSPPRSQPETNHDE
jgi:hypothetical protein